MESASHISYRHATSEWKVLVMRFVRYVQTGSLLHLMAVFSVFMSYFFMKEFLFLWKNDLGILQLLLYAFLSAYFISLIFFSQLDARSRYQNYKMLKDKFFEYGFDARLLRPFAYSRCQRDAIGVAARELGFETEWRKLVYKLGFRWYHLLPHIIVRNPRILFTRAYWSKTLFVKTYHSKYFLW